jgi:superfamily I DNA/RNA helicase
MISTFPSLEQKHVIENTGSALIIAGPGTGKTRTAIEKARWSIHRLTKINTQKVLFLSFSNAAVFRLSQSANMNLTSAEKKIAQFQTYHSFASDIIKSFGRFVGLPSKIRIADTLERTFIGLENNWEFSDPDIEQKYLNLAKTSGLVTFDNIIPFAIKILKRSPTIKEILGRKYPVIIVDEFQDTSREQWELLKLVGATSSVTVFGDPNQIIYAGIHEATSERFQEFRDWKMIVDTKFTPQNFRFGSPEILVFADKILNSQHYMQVENSGVEIIPLRYRTQLRGCLALIWLNIREKVGRNETVGFLTPSNKLAEEVSLSLRNPPTSSRISFSVFAPIVSEDAANDSVRLSYCAFREYSRDVDVRTMNNLVNSVLALRVAWNKGKITKKDVVDTRKALEKQLSINGSFLSMLRLRILTETKANMIREFVQALSTIPKLDKISARIIDHGMVELNKLTNDMQMDLFEEDRKNRNPKGLFGVNTGKCLTQVMTFHKAKGREFDFVVMISDPRQESSRATIDEKKRINYVSATRAKKWLGVIYFSDGIGDALKAVVN